MPISQDEQQKYKSLYLQTARDYIKEMKANMAHLKTGKPSKEAIETLHRAAHSLTSQSIMMSYQAVGETASLLEKIFAESKEKDGSFEKEEQQVLSQAIDGIDACLDQIDLKNAESDLSDEQKQLNTILQGHA